MMTVVVHTVAEAESRCVHGPTGKESRIYYLISCERSSIYATYMRGPSVLGRRFSFSSAIMLGSIYHHGLNRLGVDEDTCDHYTNRAA